MSFLSAGVSPPSPLVQGGFSLSLDRRRKEAKRGQERGVKRRGLGFLPSVWFPVCRWEDVETVAAAFTQRCSFLTPGDALRRHSRRLLIGSRCLCETLFLSLTFCCELLSQFPPPVAVEGSLISPHTSLTATEVQTLMVSGWLVSHLVSEWTSADTCHTLTLTLMICAEFRR